MFPSRLALLLVLTVMSILPPPPAFCQDPFTAWIEKGEEENTADLSWNTRNDYFYFFQVSDDLNFWHTGLDYVEGDGSSQSLGFYTGQRRQFFRVVETGFLLVPGPSEKVDLVDGVPFGFHLAMLPTLPAKIRLYSRAWNAGAPWSLIGTLTDFAILRGKKTLKGGAVWIPSTVGEYEVKAEAVDSTGTIMVSDQRRVVVGNNTGPTIEITGFSAPLTISGQSPQFELNLADAENDEIRRVEYFVNGLLLGNGVGENLKIAKDYTGEENYLLKGTHTITAKAYDSRGGVSDESPPYIFTVPSGNSRPLIVATLPTGGTSITQGDPLLINVSATDPDGVGQIQKLRARALFIGPPSAAPVNRLAEQTGPVFGPTLTLDTTNWPLGTHVVEVEAVDFFDTDGEPDSNNPVTSLPTYLKIEITAPDEIANAFPKLLAETIVDGVTVTASEARFSGVRDSSGLFIDGVASGLQMAQGIVLTTGWLMNWNRGDEPDPELGYTGESTSTEWRAPGDDDLQARAAGSTTADAAILEFTITSTQKQLELEFQFGSEEYDEYITYFNDAFVVMVDDVIVNLLPDASDIVAVNSVHNGRPAGENTFDPEPVNNFLFLDDDDDIDPNVTIQAKQVEYDGVTVKLRAHILAAPGEHAVKIVIGDVDDAVLDSALFIKKASFRSINPQP